MDKRSLYGTVLVVKWLRIHPEIQEMQVQSLVRELRSHMLRATRCSYQGCMPQLESLCTQGKSHMPQLRPDTAKQVNKDQKISLYILDAYTHLHIYELNSLIYRICFKTEQENVDGR